MTALLIGLVVGLVVLLIVLVVAAVVVARYLSRTRGDYYTQEDEGAQDASDADTAVLQGRTGNPVEKRKEWYI